MAVTDEVLIPLAKPEALGLGVGRRSIGRKIKEGTFPPVLRLSGRLYIRRCDLNDYKARLIAQALAMRPSNAVSVGIDAEAM